jgi:hypothetical protein
MLQARRSRGSSPEEVIKFFLSMYIILPAALGLVVYSAPNTNKYQKIFLEVKCSWRVRLTT